MPRQARLDVPGVLHHVMIRGIERTNIFRDNNDRDYFIDRLAVLLPETKTACYAWAFIPNHAHFLLRSGPAGIAALMRKLLTGYVVSFNRRHKRSGQLFQNRYKSIICQEDRYFIELVRYIHLNPLRAKVTSTLPDLDAFPYAGHSCLVGKKERIWQGTEYVLRFFSDEISKARKTYRAYLKEGIEQGARQDLSGGGLVRSLGGWAEITGHALRTKGDQRILGDSEFVLGVLNEAGEHLERKTLLKHRGHTLDAVAETISRLYNINREDILSKGRQSPCVEARSVLCHIAKRDLGISLADLARRLGMTVSAIGYAATRGKAIAQESWPHLERIY
jgi:putative transposase